VDIKYILWLGDQSYTLFSTRDKGFHKQRVQY
jgi:hypothetical protein